MEKLKDENVLWNLQCNLDKKERDNKIYAYAPIRADNQNLLFTISELKTRLANAEKEKGTRDARVGCKIAGVDGLGCGDSRGQPREVGFGWLSKTAGAFGKTQRFWHTLKEDGSKYRLTFMLDKKVLSLTLDDFRTIFHLPQANDNNHDSFVPPPSFLDMVLFYKQQLGFTIELKTSSSFKDNWSLNHRQKDTKINLHANSQIGMITEEMKHTKHYRMYAECSKTITEIVYRLPERRSTLLLHQLQCHCDTSDETDFYKIHYTVSLAKHQSRERDKKSRENVEKFTKSLAFEE
ncbi:hypothetical protein Tco_0153138 [Tanacetum coccineum]